MKDKSRWLDGSLIVGGVILAGITLRSYKTYDSPIGQPRKFKLSLHEAQNTSESIRTYLHTHPEDFNAWARLGIANYYAGPTHYAEGLNAIDKARQLGATSETLFYYAGVMYDGVGLPEYALNELAKYLRHYPEDFEIQVRVANLYAKQDRSEEAYKRYEVLTKKWPRDPMLWFNFGIVCKEKGELDKASLCFSTVESLTDVLPEGQKFHQGEIARLKGLFDESIVFYKKEIELHPHFLPALVALESVQRKKSLWKEARETRLAIVAAKQALVPPSPVASPPPTPPIPTVVPSSPSVKASSPSVEPSSTSVVISSAPVLDSSATTLSQ